MSLDTQSALIQALIRSPALFPYDLDHAGQVGHFFQLSETDYAAASFLDNRGLHDQLPNGPIAWPLVEQAAAGLQTRCDFIFHVSHCGSTLLSRLLGLAPDCFGLREPWLLRKLALGHLTEHTSTLLRLWSRTFGVNQRALIKATSFVSERSSALMHWVPDARALLMYVPLETFLPALLDGAMSDVNTHLESRLKRLQNQGILGDMRAPDLSPGQAVTISWLCEILSLSRTAAAHPDRCLWLNFDRFLTSPAEHFGNALAHLEIQADVDSILDSPLMGRYSKRIDVAYTGMLREQLLAEGRLKCKHEILRGWDLLSRADIQRAIKTCPSDAIGLGHQL